VAGIHKTNAVKSPSCDNSLNKDLALKRQQLTKLCYTHLPFYNYTESKEFAWIGVWLSLVLRKRVTDNYACYALCGKYCLTCPRFHQFNPNLL